MVILDCWKHTIFIKEKSAVEEIINRTHSRLIIRPPSPECQCSCHRASFVVRNNGDYSTVSTLYDCHSNHLYSTVLKNRKLNKNRSCSTTYESYPGSYFQRSTNVNYRSESNYSDISVNVYEAADRYKTQISTNTSLSSYHHRQQQLSNIKPKNILYLIRIDPFKFAAMEPLNVENKLIVFSLVDTFTKLSPNKILENYIKKLQDEGKTNIVIFNLSEPLQYVKNGLIVPIYEYGWPEKRAPSLEKLCSLCKAIDCWLNADRSRNFAIIYSKRDLSRASLAIAVFLQYIRICLGNDTVFDYETMYNYFHFNLEQYLQPSQKRYVNYFTNLLSGDSKINSQKFHLNKILLRRIPNFDGNGLCKPFIKIYQGLNLVYSSQIFNIDHDFTNTWDFILFDIQPPLKLRGEILIKCYHKIMNPSSRMEMFSFQFHTGTLTSNLIVFNKQEIDIALYDKRFHEDTQVELIFNDENLYSELIQNVDFIEDDQITKCNSYENFFSETTNLEYTKGPLDGSLYATVSKKSTTQQLSPNVANEIVLDEIINEIFSEISSFPDASISSLNLKPDNEYYDYLTLEKNSIKKENIDQNLISFDNDESSNLNWLQKQQQKLKNKQTNKDFIEKHLMAELKSTIKNQNIKNLAETPKVPIRTSSRNILGEVHKEKDEFYFDNSPQENGISNFFLDTSDLTKSDQSDHNSINTEGKSLTIRSSTPAFPVRQQRPLVHKDESLNNNVPLFIKDTSAYWYKPNISREEAVKYLYDKPPGSFIIRDSNSFLNAFGLAVKVTFHDQDPVRHFLIESTNKGVQIKGCPEEPVFSSLAALVYQHSITRISLPIALIIPSNDIDDGNDTYLKRFYENGAACNVLYFTSDDVESLTGPMAVKKVVDNMFENSKKIKPAMIHFKASIKGITLTDNSHKIFFRQHYPLKSISYCSIDPENRCWFYNSDQTQTQSYLFGFVTKKKNSNVENICLIFGHFEPDQPSHAIVDFVNKLIHSCFN